MNNTLKKAIVYQLFCLFVSIYIAHPVAKAQAPANVISVIKELTHSWNNYLVQQDYPRMLLLYADTVDLYGSSTSGREALSRKQVFLKKHPGFSQTIEGAVRVTRAPDNCYRADFQKHYVSDGKAADVAAYLVFKKTGSAWQIVTESDALTDANRVKQKHTNDNCADAVIDILESSPVFIKMTKGLYEAVVKNGGTSYGIILEGSPQPERDKALDYSQTYDLQLHETYPDRNTVVARFVFNPAKDQLYQYQVATDELKPITYNSTLLARFKTICR